MRLIGGIIRNFILAAAFVAAATHVQAEEVMLPPAMLGYWCYQGNLPNAADSAVYDRAMGKDSRSWRCKSPSGGGEDLVIWPNGYTAAEVAASYGTDLDSLTCRLIRASVDRYAVYTVDYKCSNGPERWLLRLIAPDRLVITFPDLRKGNDLSPNQTGCRVNDPTGTPLNVRTTPNGNTVGTLNNGDLVSVLDRASDRKGKRWVYVGNNENNKPIGWVYREFITCQ
jgi:hypothetical protein